MHLRQAATQAAPPAAAFMLIDHYGSEVGWFQISASSILPESTEADLSVLRWL